MPTVRNNERSEAIKVITYINSFLQNKTWRIRSAGGETTIEEGKDRMFPDVVLYGDSFQAEILQGWELKMPDVPINDKKFVGDAQRKAITLRLNSCLVWNFTSGVLYKRNDDDSFTEIKRWDQTNYIKTRQDVDTYQKDWKIVINEILEEINHYFLCGHFMSANLGDIIPDAVLYTIIAKNRYPLAEQLKNAGCQDVRIQVKIQKWWKQVRTEYASEEPDAYVAYARVIMLNWCNRVLFAHVIKRYHNIARSISSLTYESTPAEANKLFDSISRTCDYYNIFSSLEFDENLPQCAWRDLMELNEFLSNNAMVEVNQAALQTILERTISSGKRELIGQFTTPDRLAMLLTRITMLNLVKPCIDPCCGTGTIPQAMLKNKTQQGIPISAAYETVWASDKFSFPLQIASISLARMDATNQPLKIFQRNAFELEQGQSIPLTDPATGQCITCKLPLFQTIVSNLPFVPFEIINDDEQTYIARVQEEIRSRTLISLDERSDLYQYLVLYLHKMLDQNGRLGIITSNSWLGTKSGRLFFEILGWYYEINQIHISRNGRWFHNADVVAVILILTKKSCISAPAKTEVVRFYSWHKDLQHMESDDMEALINDALLNECQHPQVASMFSYTRGDIDLLASLNISLNALFHNVLWLKDIAEQICPVTDYLQVTRGERRGWDKMFYPGKRHGIETNYIKKVLKSSKQLTSLCAIPDSDAFCCSASISALEKAGHKGALAWIRSFENVLNGTGKPLPQVLARKNRYWYEMRDTATAEFVTGMNPDRRLFVAKFDEPTFVNQRLIAFKRINDRVDADLLHALLNSILSMFYIEAIGFGRGLGALDINATNIGSMMILNPARLTSANAANILAAFEPLKHRKILGTTKELEQEDRIHFDHIVLTAFGIDRYYDSMRDALLSMQRQRYAAKE